MLEIPHFKNIQKIQWKDLRPGMVFVGGIQINGAVPWELQNYPVLTEEILTKMNAKYHFLSGKEILVAEPSRLGGGRILSETIKKVEKKIQKLNQFRHDFLENIKRIKRIFPKYREEEPVFLQDEFVETTYLRKDFSNSFAVPKFTDPGKIPSLLGQWGNAVSLADIFTNKLKSKWNLPEDVPVNLHIVIDYSYSMNHFDKIDLVISALHSFYHYLSEMYLNLNINLYAFSEVCQPVRYPLSGREIERKNTVFSSFMKKVLHHKNPDQYNKVILFTDGLPNDLPDALVNAERMKKQEIDYTQIIFAIEDEFRQEIVHPEKYKNSIDGFVQTTENPETKTLTDAELKVKTDKIFQEYTRIAEACGGNQIIITQKDLVGQIAIECYDRYMGLLTVAERTLNEEKNIEKEDKPENVPIQDIIKREMEKKIRPAVFKKIERPGQ